MSSHSGNGVYFTLSNGLPFTLFTFTISFSGAILYMALVISKLLSDRFSVSSGVRAPLALVVAVVVANSPSPPTVHQYDDSRVKLTTLPNNYLITTLSNP